MPIIECDLYLDNLDLTGHSGTKKPPSIGAIVGGVVGGIVAIAIITFLVVRFARQRRRNFLATRRKGTSAIPFSGSHARLPSDFSASQYTRRYVNASTGSPSIGIPTSISSTTLPSGRGGFHRHNNSSATSIPGQRAIMSVTYSTPSNASRSPPIDAGSLGERTTSPLLSMASRSTGNLNRKGIGHSHTLSNHSVSSLHERAASFTSSNEMPEGAISPFILPSLSHDSQHSPDPQQNESSAIPNAVGDNLNASFSPPRRAQRKNPPPYSSSPASPNAERDLQSPEGRESIAESQILLGSTLVPGLSRDAAQAVVDRLESSPDHTRQDQPRTTQNEAIQSLPAVRKESL